MGEAAMNASSDIRGEVGWSAPANIALVKYWGKRAGQLPQNVSIGMTLEKSRTRTTVRYAPRKKRGVGVEQFCFAGHREPRFEQRVACYLEQLGAELPSLSRLSLSIQSDNTFPHSCGIASSASAFAALSLCLCEIEQRVGHLSAKDFRQKASRIARLGSGSACRSLYGPMSIWGQHPDLASCDDFAVVLSNAHPQFLTLQDAICIVDDQPKKIASSLGHSLMEDNPFALQRYRVANQRAGQLVNILHQGDLWGFVHLVEAEAMALHGLMMLSARPYCLLRPQSLLIMERIVEFRAKHQVPVAFTLDAGANIHLLYFASDEKLVANFLTSELAPHAQRIIGDFLGQGPTRVE